MKNIKILFATGVFLLSMTAVNAQTKEQKFVSVETQKR